MISKKQIKQNLIFYEKNIWLEMKSVVIPAYNEEKNIKKIVESLLELGDLEIIISDDGSTDRTREIAQKLARKYPAVFLTSDVNKGKGAALKRGFKISRGEVLGFLDADMSAHPSEIMKLFKEIERGVDLAIGSRDLQDSVVPIKQPYHRRVLGTIYSIIARKLFNIDVRDFQCGCKAFKREVWERVKVKSDGYTFDTELIAKAHALGFKIKEVPITWRDSAESKVNLLKDPLSMMLDLFRIRREVDGYR
jgi:glycosyltransferase involved in cell wall biosynthesis